MIAQLLEIYSARQFKHHMCIKKRKNIYLDAIAKKLHFKETDYDYERPVKLAYDMTIIHKINNNQLLTYKITNDLKFDSQKLQINQHMVESNSQFVHLSFNALINDGFIIKNSVGSKYHKNFIYQGAELKSVLILKELGTTYIFKKWFYEKMEYNKTIFNKKIEFANLEDDKLYYLIGPIYKILNGHHIKKADNHHEDRNHHKDSNHHEDSNHHIIEEYNPPFLIDQKLVKLRNFVLIYMSGNGTIKFYHFHKKIIITSKEELLAPTYTTTDKIYNWPNDFKNGEIAHIANDKDIIANFIYNIMEVLTHTNIMPYSESNAGFLNIALDIIFVKINQQYVPILSNVFNCAQIGKNNIIDDSFVKEYYLWIKNCAIAPHFGISCHFIESNITIVKNKDIDSKIISKLLIHFNHLHLFAEILYDGKKIGKINLTKEEEQNAIRVTYINVESNSMRLHSIFVLMDIIAAYYAPVQMSLIIEDSPNMHPIAYALQFYKWTTESKKTHTQDLYIRNCRP